MTTFSRDFGWVSRTRARPRVSHGSFEYQVGSSGAVTIPWYATVCCSTIPGFLSVPRWCRFAGPVLALAAVILLCGCGRGRSVVTEGDVHEHPRGFTILVPDGWAVHVHDDGIRLVSETIEGAGYPTIRIDTLSAHELPGDFLTGKRFRASGDRATYRYRRFTNALGNGFELQIHRSGDPLYFAINAQIWDDRLTVNRRFFRSQIWPIVNSISEPDGAVDDP